MSYDVSIQEEQDYIRLAVSGERERGHEAENAIDLWNSLLDICARKGIFRILVIYNLTGELPTMAAYNIGSTLVKNDAMKKIEKVAFVDLNEKTLEINRFTETVAVNRSASGRSKVFSNENEAKEWLLGQ